MIAGYILTGGQNRRMNGQKKLFLEYEGKTFCQHIVDAFCPIDTIFLSVDSTGPYESASLPMVTDRWPGIGPMGGIASGLTVCEEEALFVVACDMPFVDRKTVEKVLMAYRSKPILTLVELNGRTQPLFGIYPRSLLPALEAQIAAGNYRMYSFLAQVEHQNVIIDPDSHAADNINTVYEYQQLLNLP